MDWATSNKHCSVPLCEKSRAENVVLHTFPNPAKDRERYTLWSQALGPTISLLDEQYVYRNRRVCHNHFDKQYLTWTKRLSPAAVPTLQLPGKKLLLLVDPYEQTTSSATTTDTTPTNAETKEVLKPVLDLDVTPITADTKEVLKPVLDLDLKNSTETHTIPLIFDIAVNHVDDLPVLGQTGQIDSSINVDTGEEEFLETEEIVYDDGYRCPSPEVVEKEIPKVLPVLCVKCSQLIETHLYVCASCSDSQYEPLCATCAEHAALDAHAACYVLRARVTRPKTEIRGVLCAIRSELAMKSFADDLEDAITDIKSETAEIPEDTAVLDVDPFDEIDSAVAFSAEGDPNASLTTSDNEDTDDRSISFKATDVDRSHLPSPKHDLDTTPENEDRKWPLQKTQSVVQRIHVHTPSRKFIRIKADSFKPKLEVPSKMMPVSFGIQSDDPQSRSSLLTASTGLKRLHENTDNSTDIKKVKSNIPQHPQQGQTKLITVKKHVNILQKDVQMATRNVQMISKGNQIIQMVHKEGRMVPKRLPVLSKCEIPKNFVLLPKDVQNKPVVIKMRVPDSSLDDNKASGSTDYTSHENKLTEGSQKLELLSNQIRDCKVVLNPYMPRTI